MNEENNGAFEPLARPRTICIHRHRNTAGVCRPPHHHHPINLFRAIVLWLLVGMVGVPFIATSFGMELPSEQREVYLQLALNNSNGALRKPVNSGQFNFRFACVGVPQDRCSISILNKRFDGWLGGNSRVKLKATKDSLDLPDLKVIFANAISAAERKNQLSALYIRNFSDSADPDCQLYYFLQENVIAKVVIVVSLDVPELKQRFCLASQLFQGLGLSLPDGLPFSKLWKQPPDGRSAFTDDDVANLTESYGILSYIHMCPSLKPGMKANEIMQILSGPSICLDGLKLLQEKKTIKS